MGIQWHSELASLLDDDSDDVDTTPMLRAPGGAPRTVGALETAAERAQVGRRASDGRRPSSEPKAES